MKLVATLRQVPGVVAQRSPARPTSGRPRVTTCSATDQGERDVASAQRRFDDLCLSCTAGRPGNRIPSDPTEVHGGGLWERGSDDGFGRHEWDPFLLDAHGRLIIDQGSQGSEFVVGESLHWRVVPGGPVGHGQVSVSVDSCFVHEQRPGR